MSYTFPAGTRWTFHGVYAYYMTEFTIYINQIISCDYVSGYHGGYYNIKTEKSWFKVIIDRIPKFEAMLHKFPYDCLEYIAKLENNNKRMETLETNVNNLLALVEKCYLILLNQPNKN